LGRTRIGFFTDTHGRGDTPEGRTDDFRVSLCTKLEEIGSIWESEKVDYVLFGGDLFHTPDISNSVKYDIMHILKGWNKDIIGVVGSHDYFGYQMKSLKRTALGIVAKAGIMTLVGGEGLPQYIDLDDVIVVGTPHTYWLADDPINFFAKRVNKDYSFQIQLVHGDLVHKPVPWPHVTIDQVKTESDLVLSGHVHPGWPDPITIGSTTFFNPGSIARLENTGVQRTPRVIVVDVSVNDDYIESPSFIIESIELKSGRNHPFREKTNTVSEGNTMQDVTKLLNLIQSTDIDVVDIKQRLPEAARELGFGEAVIEKTFEFIDRSKV